MIEDDQVDFKEIQRLLKGSDFAVAEVHHAETLEAALDCLDRHSFDVLLVDLNLPDSTGMETVEALHAVRPTKPFVVVTGEDGGEMGLAAVARGAQDYLIKNELDARSLARTMRYAFERKKAEEAVRRERDFAERVIETTQAIVLVLDNENRIVRFNSYMSQLSGYMLDELKDKDWMNILIPPEQHQSFLNIIRITQQQTCGRGLVNTLLTKDRQERHIEWATSLLEDSQGDTIGVLATGQDITDRKKAQDAIKSQAVFRQTLLEAMPCPMYYKDCQGLYLGANKAFEKISGRSLTQIIGKTEADIWPSPYCHLSEEKDRMLLKHPGSQQYEARMESPDESVRDVIVCKSTYPDADGQVAGIIGALLDITERIQAEEAMRAANESLEQANRELKDMHAQVIQSEKLASIGQLAAGVAHELNTPVGFVASNFETLQKYADRITTQLTAQRDLLEDLSLPSDSPEQEARERTRQKWKTDKVGFILDDISQLFEESREGLSRVTAIVRNLRDFSRVDHADVFGAFDINNGIRATMIVARNAIKYDADVNLELGELPEIPCCSGQINQVLLNIVVNAAQAIKMQEREDRGTISIRTSVQDSEVICEIEDNGPGIPPDTLTRIFDPFFTTKPVGKGTGLGLSVSYDIIVNKHHGRIQANSELGKGTCFRIALPCQPREMTVASVGENTCEEEMD